VVEKEKAEVLEKAKARIIERREELAKESWNANFCLIFCVAMLAVVCAQEGLRELGLVISFFCIGWGRGCRHSMQKYAAAAEEIDRLIIDYCEGKLE